MSVGRMALISDVHSNLESLSAVLSMIEPEDELICLGDMVGYGPNPNECVELIRARAKHAILGNHDQAAIDSFGIEYFNPAARAAITWTQGVISKENIEWLDTLAYEWREPDYLLVHGAPVNYFEYILDKAGAKRAFNNTDARVIFVGHTHIADYYKLEADGSIDHAHMQNGGELTLDPAARYIVNVGSVGQPRDLNPKPSFAFFVPESGKLTFVRYDYPIEAVQKKIVDAALPEALATRLEVGR